MSEVYRHSLQRIVRLGGAVDDDMANLIVAQLLYLDSADKKRDITMYVNSPGGSVTAGKHSGLFSNLRDASSSQLLSLLIVKPLLAILSLKRIQQEQSPVELTELFIVCLI